jgi:hypothetical protein
MKNFLTALMFLAIFSGKVNAQLEYHHAIGAGGHAYILKDGSDGISGYTIAYQSRLNLTNLGEKGSVGIMAYPSFGFGISTLSGSSFLYDVPVFATASFGNFANTDTDSGFGVYGGFGYQIWAYGATDFGTFKGSNPAAIVGVRFSINDRPMDVSATYGLRSEAHVIGARFAYSLGGSELSGGGGSSKKRKRRRK